jgi:hypothetical protein
MIIYYSGYGLTHGDWDRVEVISPFVMLTYVKLEGHFDFSQVFLLESIAAKRSRRGDKGQSGRVPAGTPERPGGVSPT